MSDHLATLPVPSTSLRHAFPREPPSFRRKRQLSSPRGLGRFGSRGRGDGGISVPPSYLLGRKHVDCPDRERLAPRIRATSGAIRAGLIRGAPKRTTPWKSDPLVALVSCCA